MLIEEGLVALAREIKRPHRLNPPLLLLAQGFERLLKLVTLIGQFETEHKLLTSRTLKSKYGHRLRKMRKTWCYLCSIRVMQAKVPLCVATSGS